MGFSDLKLLSTKEYRVYLILIIWLLIGFTIYQFPGDIFLIIGAVIFLPLIAITLILLIIVVFSKKKLHEMSYKRIIISIIIAMFFIVPLIYIGYVLFWIAIISYVFITTVFTTYYFYKLGIKIDDKLGLSKNTFLRWFSFLGCIVFSILLLIGAIVVTELLTGGTQASIGFNTAVVAIVIILIIIIITSIAMILSIFGRLHTWLGIFFIWIAIYTIYLMAMIIYKMSSTTGGFISIEMIIPLYLFNLLILLNTIGSLIGEKAETLTRKLKIFGADTILLWLIFSMACYEFALSGIQAANLGIAKYIVVYVIFIPLIFLMSFYGFFNYKKLLTEKKEEPSLKTEEPTEIAE